MKPGGASLDKVIDVHDIFLHRSYFSVFFSYVVQIRTILLAILYLLLNTDNLTIGLNWRLFLGVVFTKLLSYKPIQKESVVIVPSFGVQLERLTIGVTCYWKLALVLDDEDQLKLVFQKSQPYMKVLLPVWRALCKATNLQALSDSANSSSTKSL